LPEKKFIKLISGKRYLLDTNVLIYSVDKASPFYAKAKKVVEIGIKQNVSFVITHQNLLEYTAVLRRVYKIKLEEILKDIKIFTSYFEVISPLPTTFEIFLKLLETNPKSYPFDLYLAATALDNQVFRIITANVKDFVNLGFKEVINLKDYN